MWCSSKDVVKRKRYFLVSHSPLKIIKSSITISGGNLQSWQMEPVVRRKLKKKRRRERRRKGRRRNA